MPNPTIAARPVALLFAAVVLTLMPHAVAAQSSDPLWLRPLDDLMQVQVESVAKKEQRVFDSAAAVHVVTREEIRRSGLTTVPELLRLVPGVTVSRIDASRWAVSVRGFTSRLANKLLVMIDGRSLYSRMFSGVFWDALDVSVDEIERIEVVRGPGASLWGANAVNGIINIVTRAAAGNTGTSVSSSAGPGDGWAVSAAHGRKATAGAVRVFGRVSGQGRDEPGGDLDAWRHAVAGLRFERGAQDATHFTLGVNGAHGRNGHQTPIFQGLQTPAVTIEHVLAETRSWSTIARWIRPVARGGEWQIIATHDGMQRREPALFTYTRYISDVNVQHRIGAVRRHDLLWGGGVRYLRDQADREGLTLSIAEPRLSERLFSAFAQDEISLTSNLKVALGTKLEHTAAAGWNLQPTVRGWWSSDGTTALWGSISRAVRTPARLDTSIRFRMGADQTVRPLPVVFGFVGNPDVTEEHLTAYEVGVRTTAAGRVALDVSGFVNRYSDLMAAVPLEPRIETGGMAPHVFLGSTWANALEADTVGVESVAVATLAPSWTLTGSVTAFRLANWRSAIPAVNPVVVDGATPAVQWSLRSAYSRHGYDYDIGFFKVSSLREPHLPGYARLDARVSRRFESGLEVALAGHNLHQARHLESTSAPLIASAVAVPRSISLRATWHFGQE